MVAFLKVFLIILVIVILGPIQYVFITFKVKYKAYIPQLFHKIILKVLGVKVKLIGKKTTARPLVLIGNHTSYLDIIILGLLAVFLGFRLKGLLGDRSGYSGDLKSADAIKQEKITENQNVIKLNNKPINGEGVNFLTPPN